MKRGTKKINASNPRRQAKRKAGFRKYLASAVWKAKRRAAIEAAGNQCEGVREVEGGDAFFRFWYDVRCISRENLTVHHKTYARFGGAELPEDLEVLCKDCHNRTESMKPVHRKIA